MFRTLLTGAAIMTLALGSAPASAQAGQPKPEEIRPMFLYMAPLALSAVIDHCRPSLASTGFFGSRGPDLLTRYRDAAEGQWPLAKQAMLELGLGKEAGLDPAMMADIPDETLRPMVDAIIPAGIVGEVKRERCGDIEKVVELIAPLPPENLADLIVFVVQRSSKGDASERRGGFDSLLNALSGDR